MSLWMKVEAVQFALEPIANDALQSMLHGTASFPYKRDRKNKGHLLAFAQCLLEKADFLLCGDRS